MRWVCFHKGLTKMVGPFGQNKASPTDSFLVYVKEKNFSYDRLSSSLPLSSSSCSISSALNSRNSACQSISSDMCESSDSEDSSWLYNASMPRWMSSVSAVMDSTWRFRQACCAISSFNIASMRCSLLVVDSCSGLFSVWSATCESVSSLLVVFFDLLTRSDSSSVIPQRFFKVAHLVQEVDLP